MFIQDWKREVFTIPNMLSLFRLALIPIYVAIYMNAQQSSDYIIAGAILAASCLTDAADGFIARKFNMSSTLGKILDPLADKLTQFSLIVCLSLKYPVLDPVLLLLIIKEIFQLIGAMILIKRGRPFPSSMAAGKICTGVMFISLIAMVLFPDLPALIIDAIALMDSGFLIYAFITYYFAFFGNPKTAHHSGT